MATCKFLNIKISPKSPPFHIQSRWTYYTDKKIVLELRAVKYTLIVFDENEVITAPNIEEDYSVLPHLSALVACCTDARKFLLMHLSTDINIISRYLLFVRQTHFIHFCSNYWSIVLFRFAVLYWFILLNVGLTFYHVTVVSMRRVPVQVVGDDFSVLCINQAYTKVIIRKVADNCNLVVVLQKNVLPDKYRVNLNDAIYVLQRSKDPLINTIVFTWYSNRVIVIIILVKTFSPTVCMVKAHMTPTFQRFQIRYF